LFTYHLTWISYLLEILSFLYTSWHLGLLCILLLWSIMNGAFWIFENVKICYYDKNVCFSIYFLMANISFEQGFFNLPFMKWYRLKRLPIVHCSCSGSESSNVFEAVLESGVHVLDLRPEPKRISFVQKCWHCKGCGG